MLPEQKIKHAILVREAELSGCVGQDITEQSVDRLYDELVAIGKHWDAVSEIREGEVETEIPCSPSRHYEAKSVAMRAPDGSWVGWTYWYGGGKHGCPEEVPWMEDAYDLDCKEEKKLVIVQTFTKVPADAA